MGGSFVVKRWDGMYVEILILHVGTYVHVCMYIHTSTINVEFERCAVLIASHRSYTVHPRLASHRRREQDYLRVYTYIHTIISSYPRQPTSYIHPKATHDYRAQPQLPASSPSALILQPPPTRPQSSKKDPKNTSPRPIGEKKRK